MGLLDSLTQIAGQAMSSGQGQNSLLQVVLGMVQNQQGGLGGLVQALQNKGLGEVESDGGLDMGKAMGMLQGLFNK